MKTPPVTSLKIREKSQEPLVPNLKDWDSDGVVPRGIASQFPRPLTKVRGYLYYSQTQLDLPRFPLQPKALVLATHPPMRILTHQR